MLHGGGGGGAHTRQLYQGLTEEGDGEEKEDGEQDDQCKDSKNEEHPKTIENEKLNIVLTLTILHYISNIRKEEWSNMTSSDRLYTLY